MRRREAPAFLADIDGLETNRINQLVVRPTLQTTRDDDVFAIGDCDPARAKAFRNPSRRARKPRIKWRSSWSNN